ncbi:DUF2304 domain-containing protein [Clostridium akagii]|uniref:DUF2304 domain-containing protein n=1 Tax=Clostridium akagii TaxID=91623 RepID=UPI00047A4D02|nr:DUF2304 domain-containing protein [Clostridium akagii]
MSTKLEIVLLFGSTIFLIFILSMIKKKKLEYKYALTWIITSILFIVLSIFPNLLYDISDLIGIKGPVNTLFLLILFLILNIIFTLSIAVSQSQQKVKILSQEIGIIKLEIEKFKKN